MEKEHYILVSKEPEIKVRALHVIPESPEANKDITIVILPGWLSTIENRRVLINEFSKYFSVIMYEPRGFGKSTLPTFKGAFIIEEQLKELQAVLNYFDLQDDKFVIFASSVTAALSLEYGLSDLKPRPLALALISPPQHYEEPIWMKALSIFPLFILNFLKNIVFAILIWRAKNQDEKDNLRKGREKINNANPRSQVLFYKEFLKKYDIRDRKYLLKLPIIAFTPSYDRMTPIEQSEELTKFNPLSEYHKFPKKSHRIIDENEEKIARLTMQFINKILEQKEAAKSS